MTITDPVFVSTISVVFGAIIGAYIYIHKISSSLQKKSRDDRRALYTKLDTLTTSIQGLEVSVTNRLTRIETQLGLPPGE